MTNVACILYQQQLDIRSRHPQCITVDVTLSIHSLFVGADRSDWMTILIFTGDRSHVTGFPQGGIISIRILPVVWWSADSMKVYLPVWKNRSTKTDYLSCAFNQRPRGIWIKRAKQAGKIVISRKVIFVHISHTVFRAATIIIRNENRKHLWRRSIISICRCWQNSRNHR